METTLRLHPDYALGRALDSGNQGSGRRYCASCSTPYSSKFRRERSREEWLAAKVGGNELVP
jgi:hypothetical protein